jgi:hypothetical protein
MCLVWISQETAAFVLHKISRLVLYNRGGVFTARYALSPYIKQTRLVFRGLRHTAIKSGAGLICV